MPESLDSRWQRFLLTFFGSANELDWPSEDDVVVRFVTANERMLAREPAGPLVLPCVRVGAETEYFAIALDDEQALELRRFVEGLVGATYTTYTGRPAVRAQDDQVLEAAIRLAGSVDRVFTFTVVGGDKSKREVRSQLLRLLRLTALRPPRKIEEKRPIGRLLRDFDRALEEFDERNARQLLFGLIKSSGLFSALNMNFLETRFLATFERWDELEAMPVFEDLLRASRPALVSDALAGLALARVGSYPTVDELRSGFDLQIAPKFEDLIPSVGSIRSRQSALYYVLFHLGLGDSKAELAKRLEGTSWLDDALVSELVAAGTEVEIDTPPHEVEVDAVLEALRDGRWEHAIDLLASGEPDLSLLPLVVQAVQRVLSDEGSALITRYRDEFGNERVQAVLDEQARVVVAPVVDLVAPANWVDWVRGLGTGELSFSQFEQHVEEGDLSSFARDPKQIEAIAIAVEESTAGGASEKVLPAAMLLLRRLTALLRESEIGKLTRMRRAVVELWGLVDESGDRGTASDVLDEVDAILRSGVNSDEYDFLVEILTARWSPFLNDLAFGLGVRCVEILASGRPSGSYSITEFTTPLFGRLTPANMDRIDPIELAVADRLADELELGLEFATVTAPSSNVSATINWSGLLGMYSLDEPALHRAKTVLGAQLPQADLRTTHDKVATSSLTNLAATADVMVVATQHAKHAATDAIRAARPIKPITYPSGKGSSALIRAALEGVRSLSVG